VSVGRIVGADWPVGERGTGHAHTHDFLVLTYFERGGGTLRLDGREWPVNDGDVFVIAPGEVVAVGDAAGLAGATAWSVFFPAEVLEPQTPGAFLSWRAHPLLFPFLGRSAGGAQRLRVPPDERDEWSVRIAAIERELQDRRDGSSEAILAHLTLLLVSVSRLAADVGDDLRLRDEPLLAAVFDAIEQRYGEPISLADLAEAVGLTPGHLTTVVRRKTGRTAQQWITERRMAEARGLLSATDVTVEAIAGRVGYRNASYFIKQFKHAHTVTPAAWRRQGRRQLPGLRTR
jgi:AraC-like DNA-binding protein